MQFSQRNSLSVFFIYVANYTFAKCDLHWQQLSLNCQCCCLYQVPNVKSVNLQQSLPRECTCSKLLFSFIRRRGLILLHEHQDTLITMRYTDVNFREFYFSIREFQISSLVEYSKVNAAFRHGRHT